MWFSKWDRNFVLIDINKLMFMLKLTHKQLLIATVHHILFFVCLVTTNKILSYCIELHLFDAGNWAVAKIKVLKTHLD